MHACPYLSSSPDQSLGVNNAGLSNDELLQAREEYSDHYAKFGQRPKEKIKYSFNDKEQIDYIRELTAKNVW